MPKDSSPRDSVRDFRPLQVTNLLFFFFLLLCDVKLNLVGVGWPRVVIRYRDAEFNFDFIFFYTRLLKILKIYSLLFSFLSSFQWYIILKPNFFFFTFLSSLITFVRLLYDAGKRRLPYNLSYDLKTLTLTRTQQWRWLLEFKKQKTKWKNTRILYTYIFRISSLTKSNYIMRLITG